MHLVPPKIAKPASSLLPFAWSLKSSNSSDDGCLLNCHPTNHLLTFGILRLELYYQQPSWLELYYQQPSLHPFCQIEKSTNSNRCWNIFSTSNYLPHEVTFGSGSKCQKPSNPWLIHECRYLFVSAITSMSFFFCPFSYESIIDILV